MEGETSTSHEANNAETTEVTRIWKRYCCKPQCQSNTRKNPELSFHKIPKNPEILKKQDARKSVNSLGLMGRLGSSPSLSES